MCTPLLFYLKLCDQRTGDPLKSPEKTDLGLERGFYRHIIDRKISPNSFQYQ